MRKILPEAKISPQAQQAIESYHTGIVSDAQKAVENNDWVIIGMKQNPVVKNARQYLDAKGVKYRYIEHGNYFSMWKERLAIKLWSGWPTFPQVFQKGQLVGGFAELKKYLA